MADPTDELLNERGKQHGDFTNHAQITQTLKEVMWMEKDAYEGLTAIQRESLEMIAHKIGRILAGNPNHKDHWDDIAGYARLVSQRLTPETSPALPDRFNIPGDRHGYRYPEEHSGMLAE